MRVGTGVAGLLAVLAAAVLSVGANRSGEVVRLDTVSDVTDLLPAGYAGVPSAVVFDDSSIHDYHITVAGEDWDWLNATPTFEQYVPSELEYRGRVYEDVGIRYKGYYGSLRFCFTPAGDRICRKLPLKLKFDEYDNAGRFYGLRVVNLHAMERDNTKMHEMLGYEMFRMAGVAAPRTAYARVFVNGEFLGLYLAVEQIDQEFVRHAFPDAGRGTLFREVWPEGTTRGEYEAAIQSGPVEAAADMVRFEDALLGSPPEEFVPALREWTDYETLMKYIATDRLIENFDGFVGWYCIPTPCFNHNYYWYKEAFSDRVWLIPWDLDSALMYPAPIRTPYGMPDWDAPQDCSMVPVFLNLPGRPPSCDELTHRLASQAWDDYAAASRELLAGPFELERLHERVDELSALIEEVVGEDPNATSPSAWRIAVNDLKADLGSLRAHIESKVAQ